MSETKKLTPAERSAAIETLKEKHQPLFNILGISDAYYVPKMAHYQKGLQGLHMGFFESELEIGDDIYTEKVSIDMKPETVERTLYKIKGNPHFRDEYPTSEPLSNGSVRYMIPLDEMEEVVFSNNTPNLSLKGVTADLEKKENRTFVPDPNAGLDIPMSEMTLRDYAAIHLKEPVSNKEWLNSIILNIKPF